MMKGAGQQNKGNDLLVAFLAGGSSPLFTSLKRKFVGVLASRSEFRCAAGLRVGHFLPVRIWLMY